MTDISAAHVLAVLEAHPLVGADKHGLVRCDGCHLYLGDPAEHLRKFLLPDSAPPDAPSADREPLPDPRESQIAWEGPTDARRTA